MKIRHKDVWTFEYRGIGVEINNWKEDLPPELMSRFESNWTYYLYLRLERIPEPYKNDCWLKPKPYRKGERKYSRYTESWLRNIRFHHGCTYYQRHLIDGTRGDERVVQVGCDYSHYWDQDMIYDKEQLILDAKDSIDSIYEIFPYLQWCRVCGSLHKENEPCPKCILTQESPNEQQNN